MVQDKVSGCLWLDCQALKQYPFQVQEQIKTLHMKLEELKVEHRTNEANTEGIISSLNSKLSEVKIIEKLQIAT